MRQKERSSIGYWFFFTFAMTWWIFAFCFYSCFLLWTEAGFACFVQVAWFAFGGLHRESYFAATGR
jgi:hypothetical protein